VKAGGGKQKGSEFERVICKALSLWVSEGHKEDLFWRSAMSGGRATVANKAGSSLGHHAGDISTTSAQGASLTDRFYIEAKFYRSLQWDRFLLNDSGIVAGFWAEAIKQAAIYKRQPILIAKQNRLATLIMMMPNTFSGLSFRPPICLRKTTGKFRVDLCLFDELLKTQFRDHPPARFTSELK
jgi:hypothetical protein